MLQRIATACKRLPIVRSLLKSNWLTSIRFRHLLRSTERVNAHTTRFLRGSLQQEALVGRVLDLLLADEKDRKLRIVVAGCSIGSEPYTIASVLRKHRPKLDFSIYAFDIENETIEVARKGVYRPGLVFNNRGITDEFVSSTFDQLGDEYQIKDDIASHVTFEVHDALDTALKKKVGLADVLFAQNFLYHLPRDVASGALENLCKLLKPSSALFVDGIDLDIRSRVTTSQGLSPLDFNIEEIHNDLRDSGLSASDPNETRGSVWPYAYWGLEPFSTKRADWKRRYATIFFRGDAGAG